MATFEVLTSSNVIGPPSGGGGGDTIYTGDGSLAGARVVDLDGNVLSFQQGGNNLLELDPVGFTSTLTATDATAQSLVRVVGDLSGNNVSFEINSNDGTNEVSIAGDGQAQTLSYTADTHNFTGGGLWDLDGNTLQIQQGGNNFLELNPTAGEEIARLQVNNLTGDGNQAYFSAFTTNTDATATIGVSLGFETESYITAFADATTSTIQYTADSHTFNGNVGVGVAPGNLFEVTNGAGGYNLQIDNTQFASSIESYNGTAQSYLRLRSDLGTNAVIFNLSTYDGTNQVNIYGDAVAQTITLTAVHFNYAGLQDFASNAAAISGGLVEGDLYYTRTVDEAIVKIVVTPA